MPEIFSIWRVYLKKKKSMIIHYLGPSLVGHCVVNEMHTRDEGNRKSSIGYLQVSA